MKTTLKTVAMFSLLALIATGCGNPFGKKTANTVTTNTAARTTLNLTITLPNYQALIAAAQKNAAGRSAEADRIVDPNSTKAFLYLSTSVYDLPPDPTAGLYTAQATLTLKSRANNSPNPADGITPDFGTASFDVISGRYAEVLIELCDAANNVLTWGHVQDYYIIPGICELSLVAKPALTTPISIGATYGKEAGLLPGHVDYLSFMGLDGSELGYNFIASATGTSAFMLYEADGRKPYSGAYYTVYESGGPCFIESLYQASVYEDSYIAVYANASNGSDIGYDLAAVPVYSSDGTEWSGQFDAPGDQWLGFPIKKTGGKYLITINTEAEAVSCFTRYGAPVNDITTLDPFPGGGSGAYVFDYPGSPGSGQDYLYLYLVPGSGGGSTCGYAVSITPLADLSLDLE